VIFFLVWFPTLTQKSKKKFGCVMDGFAPANVDPADLPEGFQAAGTPIQGGTGGATSEAAAAAEEQRLAILQQVLTPEALGRLQRIKLVRHDKAKQVENGIIAMAKTGKLPGRINEGKLIEMLERGSAKEAQKQTSISIQRKKYVFDSDDEDDNDEDLM
jgi:programmed cell death protein 5